MQSQAFQNPKNIYKILRKYIDENQELDDKI